MRSSSLSSSQPPTRTDHQRQRAHRSSGNSASSRPYQDGSTYHSGHRSTASDAAPASNLQPHYRSMLDVDDIAFGSNQRASNRIQPSDSDRVTEDDLCPVCHFLLPTKSSPAWERAREQHVISCIDLHMQASSVAARPGAYTSNSQPQGSLPFVQAEGSPSLPLAAPIPQTLHQVDAPNNVSSQRSLPAPPSSLQGSAHPTSNDSITPLSTSPNTSRPAQLLHRMFTAAATITDSSPSSASGGLPHLSHISPAPSSAPAPSTPELRMAAREAAHLATITRATSSSAPLARPVGMHPYLATEKDCVDDAECTICLEEFEVGVPMARLECLCRYHRKCIREWFVEHPGRCPVHQHDGYGF